jgi:putative nucleotidyltransferase with HDIG domain
MINLPTEQEIEQLHEYYRIPDHLLKHVRAVKKVVLYLATELNKKGEDYNVALLGVAAELHDIGKPLTFPRRKPEEVEKFGYDPIPEENFGFWKKIKGDLGLDSSHPELGAMILRDYPELAEVVGNHSVRQILNSNLSKEAVLLNYVDKITMTKVVTLEQRFAYLRERYSRPQNEDERVFARYKQIETEIFNKLGFPAEELAQRIENG